MCYLNSKIVHLNPNVAAEAKYRSLWPKTSIVNILGTSRLWTEYEDLSGAILKW